MNVCFSTCPTGTYSSTGTQPCSLCPAGSSCLSNSATVTPCAAGYYSLEGDMSCTLCPDNRICPLGSAAPQLCPAGQYTNDKITCIECPSNTKCDSSGKSACSEGQYQVNGVCMSCPSAHVCSSGIPLACPAGKYFPSTSAPCVDCPENNICPPFAVSPISCPAGTYTSDRISCILCPAGSKCPGGSPGIISCPIGTYQHLTGQTTCFPCISAAGCTTPGKNTLPEVCKTGTYYDGLAECIVSLIKQQ